MYSLDINFLKDRTAAESSGSDISLEKAPKRKLTVTELIPAFIGGGTALLLLALTGGAYFFVGLQKSAVQEKLQILDGEILALQAKELQINQLQSQVNAAQRQATGLAQVFARILPWSAIIEDIRARIPDGVQLVSFSVADVELSADATAVDAAAAAATEAVATAVPMPMITFSGLAESYDEVNYFLITLQRSAFINGDNARITNAALADDPNSLTAIADEGEDNTPQVDLTLPQVVQYTIEAQVQDLTTVPSEQLITQLENKKNKGSVIRLKKLRDQGILGNTDTAESPAAPADPTAVPTAPAAAPAAPQ